MTQISNWCLVGKDIIAWAKGGLDPPIVISPLK